MLPWTKLFSSLPLFLNGRRGPPVPRGTGRWRQTEVRKPARPTRKNHHDSRPSTIRTSVATTPSTARAMVSVAAASVSVRRASVLASVASGLLHRCGEPLPRASVVNVSVPPRGRSCPVQQPRAQIGLPRRSYRRFRRCGSPILRPTSRQEDNINIRHGSGAITAMLRKGS
jgi:hypothetical protein